ncbi:hypothetical protein [Lactobacillus isalae]|uniref:hypothetical protein n=1 Tax=Lactobacillus isalae TaxID=2993455 RepID=UPI0024A7FEC4|nr:hypothetical protein [Lactobacillus isalae]
MNEQENILQLLNDQQAELNAVMSYELGSFNTVGNLYEHLIYEPDKGDSKRTISAIKATIRNLDSIKENASGLRRILAHLQEKIEQ